MDVIPEVQSILSSGSALADRGIHRVGVDERRRGPCLGGCKSAPQERVEGVSESLELLGDYSGDSQDAHEHAPSRNRIERSP